MLCLEGVDSIGIDEFAVRKGHVYKTIVVDLKSGRIPHVGQGKAAMLGPDFGKGSDERSSTSSISPPTSRLLSSPLYMNIARTCIKEEKCLLAIYFGFQHNTIIE